MTTLSLVSFCPHCYAQGQPKLDTSFVVYGRHHNCFHIYKVERKGVMGFVPHVVQLKKVINAENVVYDKACGICGVKIWEGNDNHLRFLITKWERGITTLKEWNAWVQFQTDPDYFI